MSKNRKFNGNLHQVTVYAKVYICTYFVYFVIQTGCYDKYRAECLFSPYLNRRSIYVGQDNKVSC